MQNTARLMTIEHLGGEATEADLRAFREAVLRYQCEECGRGEWAATELVWGQGDYLQREGGGHCQYCHQDSLVGSVVPGVEDDQWWALLAKDHRDDCEWVNTRAFRI